MLAQPSIIKRPVLELGGGKLLVGFKPEQYEAAIRVAAALCRPRLRPGMEAGTTIRLLRLEQARAPWKSHSPAAPPS